MSAARPVHPADADTMTRDELIAWADAFWSDTTMRLSRGDLMNLTIAVARAARRPRKGDADGVWTDLLRKLSHVRDEVEVGAR